MPLFRFASNFHVHSYGYLWWLGRSRVDSREINWVAGIGYGGQKLYVVPSLDLVIVVTADDYKLLPAPGLVGNTALDIVLRAAVEHGANATSSQNQPVSTGDQTIRTGKQ